MKQFLVGTTKTNPEQPDYQSLLKLAYENKTRPLCLCNTPHPPMYIAKYDDDYLLKKMPNSGSLHLPICDLFDMPVELSGRGSVETKAIEQSEEQTNLKVNFNLAKRTIPNESHKEGATQEATSKKNIKSLSILAVLHYLYEEAGLNKWYPAMEGKRSWTIIRHHLLLASEDTTAKNNKLAEILLIPEAFNYKKIDDIKSRRAAFIKNFHSKTKEVIPFGLLVGEVKSLEKSKFNYKLLIKHLPEMPVYLTDTLYRRINKQFSKEFTLFQNDESLHFLAIATFSLSPADNLQIETIALMIVDENWLPVGSDEELALIKVLVEEKRSFIKGLRYNLPDTKVIAAALLIDTENPTPIYSSVHSDEAHIEKINTVIKKSEYEGIIWDEQSNVSSLPEIKSRRNEKNLIPDK